MSVRPPTSSTQSHQIPPRTPDLDPELDEGFEKLSLDDFKRPDTPSGSLRDRDIRVLSPVSAPQPTASIEAPRTEAASAFDPHAWVKAVTDSWNSLELETARDPSIPLKALYPSDLSAFPPAPHLEPIENTKTGELWEICGHWITNPHDTNQTVAVFQYPFPEESLPYWSLVHQYDLQMLDLTHPEDDPKLKTTAGSFRVYPPNDDTTYQMGTDLRIKCYNKVDGIGFYRIRANEQEFEKMVFHYRYWPDGGIIGLEALDALVDYVSTYPKVGIHCVAGVGRTGTLTTAAFIKHLIQKGRIQESDFTLNWLHDLVLQLRRQRSCKWVSTILQYELLYRYGLWQFRKQSATPDS